MNKKQAWPDELRMPAEKFDEMMRRALGAPPPTAAKKPAAKPRAPKDKKQAS